MTSERLNKLNDELMAWFSPLFDLFDLYDYMIILWIWRNVPDSPLTRFEYAEEERD